MKCHRGVILSATLFCMVWTPLSARCETVQVTLPNIILIFADDLSYEAVGFAGREQIATPNIDRLAKQGTVFSHAHNMGGWHGALCVASRTMLMTGRSLWRAHSIEPVLNEEILAGRFLPKILNRAGYRTYYTGKWHISASPQIAFDRVLRVLPGMPVDGPEFYHRPPVNDVDRWSPSDPAWGGYWDGEKHWTERTADDVIQLINEAEAQPNPYFVYAAFNAPHDPRQSPKPFLDRYPIESIPVPRSFLPAYPFADAIGCDPRLRDEALAPMPRTEHAIRTHRREYFAMISHLDRELGRVLDHIDRTSNGTNTVVIFTSDQGLSVGHHGLMGKQNPYDVSTRSPFVLRGPNIPAGQVIDEPIYVQDAMATCIALSGQPIPEHVEFHDLRPLLDGAPSPYREGIYFGYMELQRAVTKGSMKLISYPKAGVVRLFDLRTDPEEMHDLAKRPEYATVVHDLSRRLESMDATLHRPATE